MDSFYRPWIVEGMGYRYAESFYGGPGGRHEPRAGASARQRPFDRPLDSARDGVVSLSNPLTSLSEVEGAQRGTQYMSRLLRKWLACGTLAVTFVVAMQLSYLVAQLSEILNHADVRMAQLATQGETTLLYSQAVLASVRGTTEQIRKSAEYQVGYYEAVGRRTSSALAGLNILLDNLDDRTERMAASVERTEGRTAVALGETAQLAAHTHQAVDALAEGVGATLGATVGTLGMIQERVADERVEQALTGLAASSANVARGTAAGADAAEHVRELTDTGRKGPLRWLWGLLF